MLGSANPWTFGINQLFTSLGLLLTLGIAIFGFRSFKRWRREKIEEKRIDVAVEALAIAYEATYVFDNIRRGLVRPFEWADLPRKPHESDEDWDSRGPYFASLKRIEAHKEFFDRVWNLQPRCMAVLGADIETTFNLLHEARAEVGSASEMLAGDANEYGVPVETKKHYRELRRNSFKQATENAGDDPIEKRLLDFRRNLEFKCRPIVERGYAKG